jgi:hypothetical protein
MAPATPIRLLQRAWYAASFDVFSAQSDDEILGQLTQQSNHAVELAQRDAWLAEIELLRRWLKARNGTLLLEFNIPRMGLRADAVLVIAGCIVILEFKVGDSTVSQSALNQVWQYALDTKNFHETSHELPIIPILVPTGLAISEPAAPKFASDRVSEPIALAPQLVPRLLDECWRRPKFDPPLKVLPTEI